MRFGESARSRLVSGEMHGTVGEVDLPGPNFAFSHLQFTTYISVFAYRLCDQSSRWCGGLLRVQQAGDGGVCAGAGVFRPLSMVGLRS